MVRPAAHQHEEQAGGHARNGQDEVLGLQQTQPGLRLAQRLAHAQAQTRFDAEEADEGQIAADDRHGQVRHEARPSQSPEDHQRQAQQRRRERSAHHSGGHRGLRRLVGRPVGDVARHVRQKDEACVLNLADGEGQAGSDGEHQLVHRAREQHKLAEGWHVRFVHGLCEDHAGVAIGPRYAHDGVYQAKH
eukprot:scaffold53_cov193-Pinguiococcus_pyrenoidosus.AAC.71